MICIECEGKVECTSDRKINCTYCNLKYDKYTQVNNTLKYIDCLLLKPQIFRHFLVNIPISKSRLIKVCLLQILSILVMHNRSIKSLIDFKITDSYNCFSLYSHVLFQASSLCMYVFTVSLCLNGMIQQKILFSLLFSSFFNYLKFIFTLWKYNVVLPFVIIEFLNCNANIIALRNTKVSMKRIFYVVYASKLLSYYISVQLINKKYNITNNWC